MPTGGVAGRTGAVSEKTGKVLDGRPQLLVEVVAQQRVASVNGPPGGAELDIEGLKLADPSFDSGWRCPID